MTETVAPYDITRATPQPSQVVASAAPAQQSDAGPRATAVMGQQFNEAAAEVDRYGLHLDTLQAQDALNQLRSKKDDLTYGAQGFMQVKGGDVIKKDRPGGPLLDDYSSRLQAVSDDLTKNLGPRARMMYNERAAGEMLGLKSDIAKHSIQQTELYTKSVFASGNAQDTSDAVRYSGDPGKVAEFATRARERATKYAQSEGLDPGFFAASAESNVVRAAIESRAAQNDAAGALTLFKTFGDKLDAKDTIEVGRTMKTVQTGQDARAYVADLNVDEGARRDSVIKGLMGEGYSPALAAGFAANFFHESRFRTNVPNKGDGRDGSDSINIGQWNGPRAIALQQFAARKGLDLNDPNTGMLYAKAELEGEIPESVSGITPEMRARIKAAKTPAEAAAMLSQLFFRPAGGAGEAAARGQTAEKFNADYMKAHDPLAEGVNSASPVPGATPPKAEGPPGFLDTRQMTIDAEKWHLEASARNQRDNAARPDLLSAAKSLIDVQYETRKAQVELAKNQLNKAVEDWVSKPQADGRAQTERPPPEIWNQLTYEKQRSIDATLAHNAKGTDGPTDQQTWYTIQRGLSSPDPNERAKWADVPLWQYKDKLSNTDFQELAKMQGTVRKGDPDKELTHVRGINQMTDDALLTMKIDPTPKPGSGDADKAAKFRRAIQDQLTEFETQKGKKATPDEIQKIIDGQVRQIGGTSSWWFGSDKRRFEMKIGDVPAAEQAKIADALKRAGRPVTDDAVIDLYVRKGSQPPAPAAPAPAPRPAPPVRAPIALSAPPARSRSGELPPYAPPPGTGE